MVTSEGFIHTLKVNLRVDFMFSWCYYDFLSSCQFDLWNVRMERYVDFPTLLSLVR